MITCLPELVNKDGPTIFQGRFVTAEIRILVGEEEYWVSIEAGRVTRVENGPCLMRPCRLFIQASADAWKKFWRRYPPPGYHDLFAMVKNREAEINGDWLFLMQNLRYFKKLLEAPRLLSQEDRNG